MKRSYMLHMFFDMILVLSSVFLAGCSGSGNGITEQQIVETEKVEESQWMEEPSADEVLPERRSSTGGNTQTGKPEETEGITAKDKGLENIPEPAITETDWSGYFEGINGAAVIYDPAKNCYEIYNQEQASVRRSPCSTFKIISSLTALESGILDPEISVRTWSGEIFWNEDWNRDIDFADAFHASCVWYFREVIDEIGEERMQEELNKLEYGNCDISDWSGSLNNNNSNPALTGFWIESSLLISPKEQTEVMERIFGGRSAYPEEILKELKQVMLLQDQGESDILIYGKTGMGKSEGVVVDAWYTGFAESGDEKVYFCVYLGETEGQNVSSSKAREIAVKIVSGYLK